MFNQPRIVKLDNIKNRNELRVMELLPQVLAEFPQYNLEDIDIQDIYALTLNSLPARYAQPKSIILNEPVSEVDILRAIRKSIEKIAHNSRLT